MYILRTDIDREEIMLDSLKRLAAYFYSTLPGREKKPVDPKPLELVGQAALVRGEQKDPKIEGSIGWYEIFEEAYEWQFGRKEKVLVRKAYDKWTKSGVHNEKDFPYWVRQYCLHVIEKDAEVKTEIAEARKYVFKRVLAYIIYYTFYPLLRRK